MWRVTPWLGLLLFSAQAFAFQLETAAFKDKEKIPAKYTCDGENVSPPLVWTELPKGTQSLALIADDPDAAAGTWVHWVLYDIPASVTHLAEGIPNTETLPDDSKHGITDFREVGYKGPCPPPGAAHRYVFKLYALSKPLNIPPKASKAEVLMAMNGNVLAEAKLAGNYQRS